MLALLNQAAVVPATISTSEKLLKPELALEHLTSDMSLQAWQLTQSWRV